RTLGVERDDTDAVLDRRRIPTASSQLRKRLPPVLETRRRFALRELVIPERGKHAQRLRTPDGGLRAELRVVVGHSAVPRQISAYENRVGTFIGDSRNQRRPGARVRGRDVVRIGEPGVAVSNDGDRLL